MKNIINITTAIIIATLASTSTLNAEDSHQDPNGETSSPTAIESIVAEMTECLNERLESKTRESIQHETQFTMEYLPEIMIINKLKDSGFYAYQSPVQSINNNN